MSTDKEIKREFKKVASANPEKYYATTVLREEGFIRKQCSCCGIRFWTVKEEQNVCGDPACSGGFKVVEDNPAKIKLSYADAWLKFSSFMKERGYRSIKRYPVVARWNPTTYFTIASIAVFQPYVISGETEPPAKQIVIPQFCLRFGDIDNVGITGSHLTGFVMIGQHAFMPKSEWNQDKYFRDMLDFITKFVGIPKDELTLHEDAWAGGGNFGPCMEFFSRGVELFNQVYMLYEQHGSHNDELKIKVLDMGMGMERVAWFSQATPNIYEATFPKVLARLRKKTSVKMDLELYKKFSSYSAYLNVDEVEDMDKAWERVAGKLGVKPDKLKKTILPIQGIYSIAEHARALLFAINDGALPSNVGGGYNLRNIFRRAQRFIEKFGWDIDIGEVAEWHAKELKDIFPEVSEHMDNVKRILSVEKEKFEATRKKAKEIIEQALKKDVNTSTLIELYISQGINPDMIKEEAARKGIKIDIPDNFYNLVAEMQEQPTPEHKTGRKEDLPLKNIPATEALYYDDWKLTEFSGKVIKTIDRYIILDKTAFYPTSGGQMHDEGTIKGFKVVDVFKQGNIIVHEVDSKPNIMLGAMIRGKIDFNRRKQLTQHHTTTHIINAAAKRVLGAHVNQAGAKKTVKKAHIDITHYKTLTEEEVELIEKEANKIVEENIAVEKRFMSRTEAEQKYGIEIYQGGAVPGNKLRIVSIKGVDVEACGGTHLNSTAEAEQIRILKTAKIQDGIVRITFAAGEAAKKADDDAIAMLKEAAKTLECEPEQVLGRATELFRLWKQIVKKNRKIEFKLQSTERSDGDILAKTADILKTQTEHVNKTLQRFKKDIENKI